jgi:hypothetical protein
VRRVGVFFGDIAGRKPADTQERLFGDIVFQMRRSLGLPVDALTNEDFRFHSP